MLIWFSTRLTLGADQATRSALLTFGPGANNFLEDHLALMGFDGDPIGIDFRTGAQRFLGFAFDLAGRDAWLHLDRW